MNITKLQHTPGPWTSEEWNIRNGDGLDIATVDTERSTDRSTDDVIPEHEWVGNARLIAAAPDLLDHLKLARLWLDELCGLIQSGAFDAAEDWVGANAVSTDSTLAEAISKAEGN